MLSKLISFRASKLRKVFICNIHTSAKKFRLGSAEPCETSEFENEPILDYLPDSKERDTLTATLCGMGTKLTKVPIVIGAREIYQTSDEPLYQVMPFSHKCRIAEFNHATKDHVREAIDVALDAKERWNCTSIKEKFKIWIKAAELMAGPYRQQLNAATMLGQGKTVIQAEIDASCELIDFIRYYAFHLRDLPNSFQPLNPNLIYKNIYRYRPLDGFVAAISPFNFTAIAGNLAYTPALMGNVVIWKPSDTAILSNWIIFKIMREAGVPAGVVNFLPSSPANFGSVITSSPDLGAINFTGSVDTFRNLWKKVGVNISGYNRYPRFIGECGGKNYHFIHPSADYTEVVPNTIRSAFEYSGQKCSACSRLYVPRSLWDQNLRKSLVEKTEEIVIGDPRDFHVFTSAVISEISYNRIADTIDKIKDDCGPKIICGGDHDNATGYFINPTIIECHDHSADVMNEELFGPVLSVYVYPDEELDIAVNLCTSSKYALTGAVFSKDEQFIACNMYKFLSSAGNFYINDKSTGSIVGQQPFGGSRLSGTNDKAGAPDYLLRWSSAQSIKVACKHVYDISYPYMVCKKKC